MGRVRVPVRLQQSMVECGAASLAMILSFHGRHTSVRQAREMLGVGRDGVTAAALLRVADECGLRVRAFRAEPGAALADLRAPLLAYWRGSHFVVVEEYGPRHVRIVDPARGRQRLTRDEFDASFGGIVLEMTPGPRFRRVRRQAVTAAAFILRFVPVQRGLTTAVLLASVLLTAFGLVPAALTRYVLDRVLPAGEQSVLTVLGLCALGLVTGQLLAGLLRRELLLRLRMRIDFGLMTSFLRHLFSLPYQYFQLRNSGDLLTRASSSMMLRELVTTHVFTLLLDGGSAVVYLALLWAAWPLGGGLVLGAAVVQVTAAVLFARRVREVSDQEMTSMASAQGHLVEAIVGIESLKAAGAEGVAFDRWDRLYRRQLVSTVRQGVLFNRMEAVLDVVRLGMPVLLLWAGAVAVLSQRLSVGAMVAAIAVAGMALAPIGSLSQVYQSLQQVGVHLERLRDVLDEEPEQRTGEPRRCPDLAGAITLDAVCYRYQRDAPDVVQGIDIDVAPGQRIAIVGRSGSGKSTLARLMMGLYRPSAGTIRFDGHDLESLDLPALRRQCGVVVQDSTVFSGSIMDNVTINAPDATPEEVLDAVRLARLDADIAAMPMGFDTPLSEGGTGLSGGQRQRLALARALVGKPNILVLDEATSHLDASTEQAIQRALAELPCTQIIIAHRLSTIRDSDLIVVLEGGLIVEQGRHDELMIQGGVYASLVGAQVSVP